MTATFAVTLFLATWHDQFNHLSFVQAQSITESMRLPDDGLLLIQLPIKNPERVWE